MNHPEIRKAYAAMIAGEVGTATDIIRVSLATEPLNAELWKMHAELLQMQKQFKSALDSAKRSLELDPGDLAVISLVKELEEQQDSEVPNDDFVFTENSTEKIRLLGPSDLSGNASSPYGAAETNSQNSGLTKPPVASPYQRPIDGMYKQGEASAAYGKTPLPEPIWTRLGISIAIFSFLLGLSYLALIIKMAMDNGFDSMKMLQDMPAVMKNYQQFTNAIMGAGMVQVLLTLMWMSIDLSSRHKPIGWSLVLLLFTVTCCLLGFFGPGWFLIPAYFFFGRGPKQIGNPQDFK